MASSPAVKAYLGLCGVGAVGGAGYGFVRGMNEGYNDTLRGVFPLPDEKYLRVPVSMALHGFFGAWCGWRCDRRRVS